MVGFAAGTPHIFCIGISLGRYGEVVAKPAPKAQVTLGINLREHLGIVLLCLLHTLEVEVVALYAPEILSFKLGRRSEVGIAVDHVELACEGVPVGAHEPQTDTASFPFGYLTVSS